MTDDEIKRGARSIIEAIEIATNRGGISSSDMLAMSAVAMVEIVGGAAGPGGAACFFRDLADQIERDIMQRMA